MDGGAAQLEIRDPSGAWRPCTGPGQPLPVAGNFEGVIVCPQDIDVLCDHTSLTPPLEDTTAPLFYDTTAPPLDYSTAPQFHFSTAPLFDDTTTFLFFGDAPPSPLGETAPLDCC